MKKEFKGFVFGALLTFICCSAIGVTASGIWKSIDVLENDITVVVDGIKVDKENFVYNDTTYLPLRAVAEAVGKEVAYDEASNTAYIGAVPTTNQYYEGFDANIPDYTSVTGVPLKERFDSDGSALFFYEYTGPEDIVKFENALIEAGFYSLGMDDEGKIFYTSDLYGVGICLYSNNVGHLGDLEIAVLKKDW